MIFHAIYRIMQNAQNTNVNQNQIVSRETIKREILAKGIYYFEAVAVYQNDVFLFYVCNPLSHPMIFDIPNVKIEEVVFFTNEQHVNVGMGEIVNTYPNLYDLIGSNYSTDDYLSISTDEIIDLYLEYYANARYIRYNDRINIHY